jgi:hypothetical protein
MSLQETEYLSIGNKLEAEQSQLFGKPCFKINKKAFVCFFQDSMVFKLEGISHTDALDLKDSKLFDPSGKNRPMKAWVQVSFEHKEKWESLAKLALDFVKNLKK